MLRGHQAQGARGQHNHEEQVQAGHGGLEGSFSATRSTAPLARGLALTSSAPGLAGRPMKRSFGSGSTRALTGTRSGQAGRTAPHIRYFTMRSSSEWKLMTT